MRECPVVITDALLVTEGLFAAKVIKSSLLSGTSTESSVIDSGSASAVHDDAQDESAGERTGKSISFNFGREINASMQ